MEKQIHYKLYNGRGQLMFVTPVRQNMFKELESVVGYSIEPENRPKIANNRRYFFEGFRIEGVLI